MDLRRDILNIARQQLIEHGYSQFSLRKIATQAGCSATAIYLYFENRDALVHALIDEGFDMLYERILRASLSSNSVDDPLLRLRTIAREYIAFGLENPEYYEIMFMLNPRELTRFPTEKYRRATRNMGPFIEEVRAGIAEGRFTRVDPKYFANIVWATLHGGVAVVLARRLDVRMDRGEFLEQLLNNCLEQLVCVCVKDSVAI
jgi:AcrR family transcriptional regulator